MLLGLIIIASMMPALIVIVISLSKGTSVEFPPQEFGFDQYVRALTEGPWMSAALESLQIGLMAAALSLLLGVPVAFIAIRSSLRWKWVIFGSSVVSILVPVAAYGVALYGTFSAFNLIGTDLGIVLSHVLLALPVAAILLATGLAKISPDLDRVAMTLGASWFQATVTITGRLLLPSMAAAFIVAFLTSFDEAVFVSFLGGVGISTLPKEIFESVRFGLDPAITAIGAMLIVLNAALAAARFFINSSSKTR